MLYHLFALDRGHAAAYLSHLPLPPPLLLQLDDHFDPFQPPLVFQPSLQLLSSTDASRVVASARGRGRPVRYVHGLSDHPPLLLPPLGFRYGSVPAPGPGLREQGGDPPCEIIVDCSIHGATRHAPLWYLCILVSARVGMLLLAT